MQLHLGGSERKSFGANFVENVKKNLSGHLGDARGGKQALWDIVPVVIDQMQSRSNVQTAKASSPHKTNTTVIEAGNNKGKIASLDVAKERVKSVKII